jgi:hypothetical protein
LEEFDFGAIPFRFFLLDLEQILQVLQVVSCLCLLPREFKLMSLDGQCLLALDPLDLHLEVLLYAGAFESLLL